MPYITKNDDISALPLSVRSQNCLRRAGIHTMGGVLDSLIQLLDKQTLLVFNEVHKVKRVNGEYAIDNHVLEAMPTSDEDPEIIFSEFN